MENLNLLSWEEVWGACMHGVGGTVQVQSSHLLVFVMLNQGLNQVSFEQCSTKEQRSGWHPGAYCNVTGTMKVPKSI